MSRNEFRRKERRLIGIMKRVASEKPDTAHPSVRFKRDWAYGNAGLENEKITRNQASKVILS